MTQPVSLPHSAVVEACPDLIGLVETQWRQLAIDDATLGTPATQTAWRHRLHSELGEQWGQLVRRVRAGLDATPHAVVVAPRPGKPASIPLLAALSVALGMLTVPHTAGQALHVLRRHSADGADTRWHTDGAGWARQNVFTCLLCATPAERGGATELLPWTVLREALASDHGLLRQLQTTAIPWVLDDDSQAGTVFAPIVAPDGLRYLREQIDSAAQSFPEQAQELHDLDERLHQSLRSVRGHLAWRLSEGEILLFDNRRCLHRRGPLPPGDVGDRTLVRTRLVDPVWARTAMPLF
ncbi:TauD/TfdA family dioxygenase [Streptomyces sp. MNU76]|uniref:TauD/TfdA family dioxygenase n=1 Tax=Streptomyces sp. MNU76 TaxID=2560026 RepID=UPI001E59FCB3|nr:TauD/TfdA family dioxygenase [Streptomyces sp. MNU76]MCC9707167.1 TauD/TfdA family dioxygenase [Streptomyces sp. MNU76]